MDDPGRKAKDKKALRLFVAGTFDGSTTAKGSVRHDDGMLSMTAVVIDYDEGKLSMEAGASVFERHDCPAVLAPTASWSEGFPKWRAVIPLSKPITEDLKARHREFVATVRSWGIPASGETDTLSQSYYFGTPVGKAGTFPAPIRVGGGKPLDLLPQAAPRADSGPARGVHVDDKEMADLLAIVSTGAAGVHEAMRRLSMAWIVRGVPALVVKTLLAQALDKWGDASNARWAERRAGVDRLVDGAATKVMAERLAGGDAGEVSARVDALPSIEDCRASTADRQEAMEPERLVVSGYMIANEAGGLVAPGGTGKTTLAIWEAVHIILGRPLYGLEVECPGPVVFVSAEDRKAVVVRRLSLIVAGLDLTDAEEAKVWRDFLVVDVSRMRFRLAARERYEVRPTAWVDALADKFGPLKPSYFHLDPVSLIGPGEEAGNDGMAELMRAGRNLASLTGAAVRLVHHTSKEGARNGTADQYVGRGGSAFADNGRFIHQLTRMVASSNEETTVGGVRYLVPPELGASEDDYIRGRVLGLMRHKLSYGELDQTPIFIKRTGFGFTWQMGVPEVSEAGRAMVTERKAARREAQRDGAQEAMVEYLRANPETTAHDAKNLTADDTGFARTANRAALDALLAAGRLIEVDKPGRGGGKVFRIVEGGQP
ncbi:hypothetical protein D621_05655 [beta proteobacterium AAP51]|nr:hypothetical protein D621_05655 [beta proteobacterium AAP51]